MPTGIPSETTALTATVFELLIQIIVHFRIGKPDSSKVFIPKGGSNKLGVFVGVGVVVSVLVGVFVGALVDVCEGVAVAVGVFVGVSVAVLVAVFVDVSVGVCVAVFVGVSVGVSIAVLVEVFVGVSVGVFVDVLVGVFVEVSVGVFVAVLVGVLDGVLVRVAVDVLVGVAVGARTITVSEPVLLVSLPSTTLLFGSTLAVFARLPADVGVTANVTLKNAPAGSVTAPLATQAKAVPVIEQLIVPVGGVLPLVTVGAP